MDAWKMLPDPVEPSPRKIPQYYSSLLEKVAANLLGMEPSKVEDKDIFELESLMNEIYFRAHTDGWSSDLQNTILESLARAGELSDFIKRRPGAPRGRQFFATLKKFANVLQVLALFMAEEKSG